MSQCMLPHESRVAGKYRDFICQTAPYDLGLRCVLVVYGGRTQTQLY